jgi:glycerol-3-phosphate dehydrogenase
MGPSREQNIDSSAPPRDLGSFDLVVVGGGINGVGIARDAAGRGLSVLLCEKDDLAEGTSSRSSKLVHGGLRYLERLEFRLVREALSEREILLAAAPHIIRPLRFILPHSAEQRPAWMISLGLFLYDHLGRHMTLPATQSLDLAVAPEGAPLRKVFRRGFEYSDCSVDDARLVVLNALDLQKRGGTIRLRTPLVAARREQNEWLVDLVDSRTGEALCARGRALVNAAGPWVEDIRRRAGDDLDSRVRLVKGSHIVTRKLWAGDHAYLLQNTDGRVIFVTPFEGDFCLVGTTDIPFEGDAGKVEIAPDEVDYLRAAVNRYFVIELGPTDVLASYSGVRPLYDDKAANPSAVTRDYVFDIDAPDGGAPLLSVFGGKITTYRTLAEHALEKLAPFFPEMGGTWTRSAVLPGGVLPESDPVRFSEELARRTPWLPSRVAADYGRRYGTRADDLLRGASSLADLGRHFGAAFYEREARFLIEEEWARTADDILTRRTKHVLHLSRSERADFETWLAGLGMDRPRSVPEGSARN